MLKIKLEDHEFRYEVFQIASLFYNKSEIVFSDEHDIAYKLVSGFDSLKSVVYCRIIEGNEKPIFFDMKVDRNNKKEFKNAIKLTVLNCLKELTGIEIPWGILVGIRPTKIVHESFKEGLNEKEIIEKLRSGYDVAYEKAMLTMEVAKKEARFLESKGNDISLYLGIPFCPTRCSYCSFTSNPTKGNTNLIEGYISALSYEIDEMMSFIAQRGYNVDTLYFGGGTPTALSAKQLGFIINKLEKHINLNSLREFTIEAGRADSIDKEKLEIIKSSGCNRVSINPQTMNDETLERIGRMHSSRDVVDKFNMAREVGFDNINMDLIIGLPGEGTKEIQRTMEAINKLSPENVTVHTMAIKRASILNEQEYSRKSNVAREMYDIVTNSLRSEGFYPYYMYRQKNMVSPLENIGYCKMDRECIYNIQMIAENISIIALGADAVSKVIFKDENRIERSANLKDVREYNLRVKEMVENKKALFESR